MRRASHILVIIAVLLCGLHLGAPAAWAHDEAAQHAAEEASGGDTKSHPGADKLAHGGHHHCPIAPDDQPGPVVRAMTPPAALVFARPAPALHSLAQAPPTQPPTA